MGAKTNILDRKSRERLLTIERREKAKVEDVALQERLAETTSLARARGEQVDASKGKVRIRSRDGLRFLYEAGKLDQAEFDAGLMFRLCHETMSAGPRSNLNRDIRGSNGHFAETRAFRAMRLEQMTAMAKTPRQIRTLLYVAGEGRAVRAFAKGGADQLLYVKALKLVLGEIADRYRLRFAA